jgi:high-affinity nickel-transport protein
VQDNVEFTHHQPASQLLDRTAPGPVGELTRGPAKAPRKRRLGLNLSPPERRRMTAMFGFIALLHVVGFGILLTAASGHYRLDAASTFGIGTGILAYTLGLRHAFDADHISAIDNTTRKLMAEGKRPLAVGFFFALGHSSVVIALALSLNLGVGFLGGEMRDEKSGLRQSAGLISLSASSAFMLLIAVLNLVVLISIVKVFMGLRKGRFNEAELETQLNNRGLLNRFFGPLARSVDTSWKMYPVGALFGVGFDTASEIALLVLAGSAAANGLPFWAFLSLPILFTAGMTLLDTVDGSFMNFAYGWAFSQPVRKVYYNITITFLAVAVAFFVGGLEVAQLLAGQLNLTGGFWDYASNFNLNRAGFIIVGMFVVIWAVALIVWRVGKIEQRWRVTATPVEEPVE